MHQEKRMIVSAISDEMEDVAIDMQGAVYFREEFDAQVWELIATSSGSVEVYLGIDDLWHVSM